MLPMKYVIQTIRICMPRNDIIAPRRACLGGSHDITLHTDSANVPPPTELVSVEAMIGYYTAHLVKNHLLHRDKLGGGKYLSAGVCSAESLSPPTQGRRGRWQRLLAPALG